MKAIILSLLLIAATFTHAQSVDRAITYQKGTWSSTTQKWLWNERQSCNMQITFHGNTILVADEAKSAYRTSKVQDKTDTQKESSTTWWATDEAGRKCMLTLCFYKETSRETLSVMYNDVCYIYVLANENNTDNLSNLSNL